MCYTMSMGKTATQEGCSASVERYGIKSVRPYHKELARRVVLGASSNSLCKEFHISQCYLSIIINSPLFKLEVDRLQTMRDQGVADVTKTLQELSPLALDVLERTMYSTTSEKNKIKIAESILDRAGYGTIQKGILDVTARSEKGYSDLTLEEKRRLATERIERMKNEADTKAEALKSAESISVEFEALPTFTNIDSDECSPVERTVEELSRKFVGCD